MGQSNRQPPWKLAREQHRVISRKQLFRLGFNADAIQHRLERGRLFVVHRGVYAVGSPELTQHGRWMAAVLACGDGAALSHRSALELWGIEKGSASRLPSTPSSTSRPAGRSISSTPSSTRRRPSAWSPRSSCIAWRRPPGHVPARRRSGSCSTGRPCCSATATSSGSCCASRAAPPSRTPAPERGSTASASTSGGPSWVWSSKPTAAASTAHPRSRRATGDGRGDPFPQTSLDGSMTIDYKPTLSAPGVNIWSARDPSGTINAVNCVSAETPACVPPADHPEYALQYLPLSGTSMSSPHVAGAVAVLQSYAKATLGRELTPAEVEQVLVASAQPMTKDDVLWDWPCGSAPIFVGCGETTNGAPDLTGQPYQDWQVGAGALNVSAATAQVDGLATASTAKAKKRRKKR